MGLLQPAASYYCPNESSLFEAKDFDRLNSKNYLLVQYVQVGLNLVSVIGFAVLFLFHGLSPKNFNINAKVLLAFFLVTSLGHSITALVYKIHYCLMSAFARCVSNWVLSVYTNAHLVYVILSNSPFWFLLVLILERLAAVIGWRNYENAGPVLSIFLVIVAAAGIAVHAIFPYFGNGVMRMSLDLTYAYGVDAANTITSFFITAMLFHGTISILILYAISRRKLVQCKTQLMSPYQLVENVQVTCLLLKIFALFLVSDMFGDFYLDYVDLPWYRAYLRENNFDFMSIHRSVLPIQLMALFGTLKSTSDRHNFA